VVDRGQHRYPGTCHPQGGPAQHALEVGGRRHPASVSRFLESVKNMGVGAG
jgi:hypothetical protein